MSDQIDTSTLSSKIGKAVRYRYGDAIALLNARAL
jgi:hypothetical protein